MLPPQADPVSVEASDETDARAEASIAGWVRESLAPRTPADARLVSIDGWDGAGKTTIGGALAERLAAEFVDLDTHLDRDRNGYLEHLRVAELRAAIATGFEGAGRAIVAGCMMDLALERIGRPADFRIYVMRISGMISNPDASWVKNRNVLYGDKSADELIAEEEESVRRWAEWERRPVPQGENALPELQRELIRYHKSRRPHDKAHLIVEVIERRS